MRWAQGGGGCVRSGRSARHWRGDGTRNHPSASAPSRSDWRRLAAPDADPDVDPAAGVDAGIDTKAAG
jgi:hypothetical protein